VVAPALLLAAIACAADVAAPVAGIVEQPRPFGYVIGDLVTQRLLLQRDARDLEPAALPAPGRVGAWFERHDVRIERTADGARWLFVEYQLINAPQALRTVTLPSWQLRTSDAGPAINVEGWPVSVAPLTPRDAFNEGGLEDMRQERTAPTLATRPLQTRMLASAAMALGIALMWGAWLLWRNRRDRARLPFAGAARTLRTLGDDDPAAWLALHRAFDHAAGRVLHAGTLPLLFERAPYLAAMRSEIERFYAESQARFFGAAEDPRTVSPRALGRALRGLEQRHAS
jgi:mxaA protein